MTPDSSSTAKKSYRAGDTVTTKLTLKPGNATPQMASANFTLTPPPQTYDPNRPTSFVLASWMTVSAVAPSMPPSPSNVLTLSGAVPHHIVGGTYKPTTVTFQAANEPPQYDNNPDPDGDLVLQIQDDQPTPSDKPVIQDFDLA